MPTNMVSLILLVNNTLQETLVTVVEPLTFAETAHGHPLLQENLAWMDVGLFLTQSSTPQTTIQLEELTE